MKHSIYLSPPDRNLSLFPFFFFFCHEIPYLFNGERKSDKRESD